MIEATNSDPVNYLPAVLDEYDVIVIGGGPAGASAAGFVAQHGYSVLLLERAALPRFHVGESLIPETYWPLARLGLIDRLKESAFPKKYSVQFVSDGVKESAPFYFEMHNPHESAQTWQVTRGDFDKMLMDRAMELGAVVHTSAQVTDVVFEGKRATGVKCRLLNDDGGRTNRTISSRVVIDATGQSAFIGNRLGLRVPDPRLKKGTIWTYFKGAQRGQGKDEGCTIIMQTEMKKTWFWYIPLPDDVVSIGCTGSMDYMFGSDSGTPEETFQQELKRCPAMQHRLESAERCADYFTTKDFSYHSKVGAGDGWVMIGDAFGFIDPVYSTGVFLAMKSAEFAADAIHDAFRRGDVTGPRLASWQKSYREGIELFRKLVYAFYAPDFSFGTFLRDNPQYKTNLVDMLVGDVFKPGVGDIFDAMGEVLPPLDVRMAAATE